jgi:hypothetical protein
MLPLTPDEVLIRQFISRSFVEHGFAPRVEEIAEHFKMPQNDTRAALRGIAEKHGIILHPHNDEIWIAHPFSTAPAAFWVEPIESDPNIKGWFCNCAWCALGAASLTKRNVKIVSRLGGEGIPVELRVVNGKLDRNDLVVHLPVPVREMWDNAVYTCSVILIFSNEQEIDSWCERHRIKKGGVMSIQKCYELACDWYGRQLDPDWNRKTAEEVDRYLLSIGVDTNFNEL